MMTRFWPTPSPKAVFVERRARFAAAFDSRALLPSGFSRSRNAPANRYPFRAESHFLYFVGRNLEGAALLFDGRSATLFAREPALQDVLWHGPQTTLERLEAELGMPVRPLLELPIYLLRDSGSLATLPPNDERTAAWLSSLLGRTIPARSGAALDPNGPDAHLADTLIAQRLIHDEAAIDQLCQAAVATTLTHRAAMRSTRPGQREAELLGIMLAEMTACGMEPAYSPILTVHGEILHHETHDGTLWPTDLVLADVGAETPEGWASDVTRTWPTTGHFSASQRAMYEVVLEAQTAAIEVVRPGVRFRDVHAVAARRLLEGLVDLGILQGDLDSLQERGAHTLFFFHGVGHLLGLDVHDMEDLGDRAGYAPGRVRSTRFGDAYLRLDRDLSPGMAVTIEPGLYQVPSILEDEERLAQFADVLCRDRLAAFADVRGIRIEDDVLVTPGGHRVLTEGIPKSVDEIESVVGRVS